MAKGALFHQFSNNSDFLVGFEESKLNGKHQFSLSYEKWLFPQWDEGILTMSKGETAKLEIEPEWAYGKKGLPDSKYPLHWNIIFN